MPTPLKIPRAPLKIFCQKHGIIKLALFGSAVHPESFQDSSDIDVLVEFREDAIPGLMAFIKIQDELAKMLGGRQVDLVTYHGLHPLIADNVLREAEVQYAEGA
jgi:predicted nucleotidyltransferase